MSVPETAIRVRPGEARDLDTIVAYNQAMAMETEHRRLDPAVARTGVEKALPHPDTARYFMAEVGDRVVGQAMITYEWSDWRAGSFWWIQSVYVHPDLRSRGVFRAIYQYIESLAHGTPGVCGLRLYVEKDNHRAMAAYERLGMKLSGHIVYEQDWSGHPK